MISTKSDGDKILIQQRRELAGGAFTVTQEILLSHAEAQRVVNQLFQMGIKMRKKAEMGGRPCKTANCK